MAQFEPFFKMTSGYVVVLFKKKKKKRQRIILGRGERQSQSLPTAEPVDEKSKVRVTAWTLLKGPICSKRDG